MTLIDVDGFLDSGELALRGAEEAARTIRRLDIGGSIGIDLPTAGSKSARQAAAAAIDEHLPQPFERTAVNGFGFLQIVRPPPPRLTDRAGAGPRVHSKRGHCFAAPRSRRREQSDWSHIPRSSQCLRRIPTGLEALGRQLGGAIGLRADAALPISGGYAESS